MTDEHANWRAGADAQRWTHAEFAVDNTTADACGFLGGGVADAFGQVVAVIILRLRRVIGKLIGGAVRLHDLNEEIAVGEGVETTLSAAHRLGLPAWAALTADNLSRFVIPEITRRLFVVVDNDPAGRRAADILRAQAPEHVQLETATAPEAFNDFNAWALAEAQA